MESRADIEKEFRGAVVRLEGIIRERVPWKYKVPNRRTVGHLIHECEEANLLLAPELQEARFVNAVRNKLYHSSVGEISSEQLIRATQSANALVKTLEY